MTPTSSQPLAPGRDRVARFVGAPLLALLIAVTTSWVATVPADAASNGLWSVYPTTVAGQPPRVFVQPELIPGKKYTDSITVANQTAAPLTFNLYGSDAFNTPGGGLSLRRRTDPQVGIGAWIKLPSPTLSVPAHGQAVVPFTIDTPPAATPGDHVGGIVAEETQGTTANKGSIPVTVIQAVAVRVYGRVKGPLKPQLNVSQMTLQVNRSTASQFGGSIDTKVAFTLTNSGNEVLTSKAKVALTSSFGGGAQRSIEVGQLLPGNTLHYSVVMNGVSALGHLKAQVTVAAPQASATESKSAWVLPWGLTFVVVAIVLALCLLVIRALRRRRTRPTPRHGRSRAQGRSESESTKEDDASLL